MKALTTLAFSTGLVVLSIVSFSSFVGEAQAPAGAQGRGTGHRPRHRLRRQDTRQESW